MKFLDLQWQQGSLQPELGEAMAEVLASCDFINGAATREFEAAYAAYVGSAHCVGVGNGTDSLEIILEAAGVGPGDEVIVPAMTFAATSEEPGRLAKGNRAIPERSRWVMTSTKPAASSSSSVCADCSWPISMAIIPPGAR